MRARSQEVRRGVTFPEARADGGARAGGGRCWAVSVQWGQIPLWADGMFWRRRWWWLCHTVRVFEVAELYA